MAPPSTVHLAEEIVQTHTSPSAVYRGLLPDGHPLEARQTIARYGTIAAVTVLLRTRLATRVAITRRPASGKVIDDLFGGSGPPQHLPALAAAGLEVTMAEPGWGHRWLAAPGVSQTVLTLFSQPAAKHGALLVLRPGVLLFRVLRPEPLPVSARLWSGWVDAVHTLLVQAEACPPPTITVERNRLERAADDPRTGKIVVFVVLGGTLGLCVVFMILVVIILVYLR